MAKRRIATSDQPILRCSFCSKAQAEVGKLIAGPTVFICDECVLVCTDSGITFEECNSDSDVQIVRHAVAVGRRIADFGARVLVSRVQRRS